MSELISITLIHQVLQRKPRHKINNEGPLEIPPGNDPGVSHFATIFIRDCRAETYDDVKKVEDVYDARENNEFSCSHRRWIESNVQGGWEGIKYHTSNYQQIPTLLGSICVANQKIVAVAYVD